MADIGFHLCHPPNAGRLLLSPVSPARTGLHRCFRYTPGSPVRHYGCSALQASNLRARVIYLQFACLRRTVDISWGRSGGERIEYLTSLQYESPRTVNRHCVHFNRRLFEFRCCLSRLFYTNVCCRFYDKYRTNDKYRVSTITSNKCWIVELSISASDVQPGGDPQNIRASEKHNSIYPVSAPYVSELWVGAGVTLFLLRQKSSLLVSLI